MVKKCFTLQYLILTILLLALCGLTACRTADSNEIAMTSDLSHYQTPIVQRQFWLQEEELLGYRPGFLPGVVSFDSQNRPYIRHKGTVSTMTATGDWRFRNFTEAIKAKYPKWDGVFKQGDYAEKRIVFDADEDMYMVVNACQSNIQKVLLLFSRNYGQSWTVITVCSAPPGTVVNLEYPNGRLPAKYPPSILIGYQSKRLWLFSLKKRRNGFPDINPAVAVSQNGRLIPTHTGGGSNLISLENKLHLFWLGKNKTGTAIMSGIYNRKTGKMTSTNQLALSANQRQIPAIVTDSRGQLHLLYCSKSGALIYKSLKPDTPAVELGDSDKSYSFPGIICDRHDIIHCLVRSKDATGKYDLSYLQKQPDMPWKQPQLLLRPCRPGYSNWFHKLSLDNHNRLFCSYAYFGANLKPAEFLAFRVKNQHGHFFTKPNLAVKCSRGMLISHNNGVNWRLGINHDFNPKAAVQVAALPPRQNQLPSIHAELIDKLKFKSDKTKATCVWGISQTTFPGVITDPQNGVYFLDIKNGEVPVAIGNFENKAKKLSGSMMLKAVTQADLAFIAAGEAGVYIIDIFEPEKPKLLNKISFNGEIRDLAVKKDILYLAEAGEGIRVVDVSKPENPVSIGTITSSQDILSLHVSGDTLFAGQQLYAGGSKLIILNCKTPGWPRIVKGLHVNQDIWGIGCSKQQLYLALGDQGIQVIDIKDLNNPAARGVINTPVPVFDVTAIEHVLYTAAGQYGVLVFLLPKAQNQ